MASLFSAATASVVAHHLPLASLKGVFSSMASVQWPALATQHVHDAAYYYGPGPQCDPCACCIMVSECLCLTAVCCPFLFCGATSSSTLKNVVGEEIDDVMVLPSVRNDPKAVWTSLHNEGSMHSLLDEDELEEDEDY
jgi:hypothetical protein